MHTALQRCSARLIAAIVTLAAIAPVAYAAPISILFVGNSYTFGRVDPVMHYNAANVTDLTNGAIFAGFSDATGSNPYESHPWGGVPGIFKQFTVQAGLSYDVSISARNAASLRGQYLNTNGAGWDMLGNIASKKWDAVVLQDLSDEPLPLGKSANASLSLFNFYANKIEDYIHAGIKPGAELATDVLMTTEGVMMGGPTSGTNAQRAAQCIAFTGGPSDPNSLSQGACNTNRTIKGNPNENPAANVYLYETWARPNMITGALVATTNAVTGAVTQTNTPATAFYTSLEGMTTDLHNAYFGLDQTNPDYAGVAPVGDAFMRAVQEGLATRNPYAPNATTDGLLDLWWDDNLHASKYGSYLSALVMFGTITGLDPQTLGPGEITAHDFGITGGDAYRLQQIAAEQLGFALVPEPSTLTLFVLPALALGFRRRSSRLLSTAVWCILGIEVTGYNGPLSGPVSTLPKYADVHYAFP